MAKSNLEIQINAKDNASGTLRNINQSLKEWSNRANKVALGMAAVGGAIVGMGVMAVKTYASMGSEIYDLSKKTGMGTEALSELRYMAEQCGTSLGGMESAVKKMQVQLTAAIGKTEVASEEMQKLQAELVAIQKSKIDDKIAKIRAEIAKIDPASKNATERIAELNLQIDEINKNAETEAQIAAIKEQIDALNETTPAASEAFNKLGLSIETLIALSPEEQFWTIASALAEIEDPTLQAALAVDIFGRSGTNLLPILAEGTEGIQAMKDEAAALGIVFDEEAAAKADKLDDSLNKIKQSFLGVFIAISESLLPILLPLSEKFVEIVKGIKDWVAEHPAAVKAIMAIGVALLITAAALKAYTVGLALAQALTPGVGWATLAAGLALAAGAYIAINQMMGGLEAGGGGTAARPPRPSEAPAPDYHWYWDGGGWSQVPNMQFGGIVPGPIGQPVPIIAHGGEQFAGVGNSIGGEINIYNYGSVVTMRELEDEMREAFLRIKDRNTTTGF